MTETGMPRKVLEGKRGGRGSDPRAFPRPALILGLALALGVLPGIAPAVRTLTISAGLIPWKGVGGPGNLALRENYEEFLRTHPGIEFLEYRSVRLPGVHRGAAEVMSLAATAGPDITLIPFSMLASFVREGLIQPVDDLFDTWPEKGRWPEPLVNDLKIEGHHWGSVLAASYGMFLGNPKLFKDRGLSEDDMPKSWEDFARLVPALSSPGKVGGFALLREYTLGRLWVALAREAGGDDVVRLTGNGIEVNLETESARRATEFIGHVGQMLRASPGTSIYAYSQLDDLKAAMANDKIGLLLMDSDSRGGAYMGTVPGAFSSEPLAYADGGSIFMLPSYIHDPYLRSAIWAFQTTDVWNGRKNDMLELDMAGWMNNRDIRPILGVWYPSHPAAAMIPPNLRDAVAKVWLRARPMPPDTEFEEFNGILSARLTDLLIKGGDPGTVLQDVKTTFNSKVHQWERKNDPRWRLLGWGILGIFGALLAFSVFRLAVSLLAELREHRPPSDLAHSSHGLGFSLALFAPALALSLIFGAVPLLEGLKMSLSSHVLRGGGQISGLSNYFDVIINPLTWLVLRNTFYYLFLSFLMGFVAPLLLALVLADFPVYRSTVRTFFFLPAVCSAVVIAILWQQIYKGPFNTFMHLLGFGSREWLSDPATAMFAVVLPQAWASMGVSGLIYIAGMTAIPDELYEESEVAGGGLWNRLTAVTIPYMAPLAGVSLVGWLISAARTSEHIFLMTGGGPEKATHVVGLDIFTQAYVSIRFGYAMAEVWLLVAVILLLASYQVRAIRAGQVRVGQG